MRCLRCIGLWLFILSSLVFTSCENSNIIVNNVSEREANEIVVLLASRMINAQKTLATGGSPIGGQGTESQFNISVRESRMTEAMAVLNQNGYPRKKGTSLLELFAKQGLMTSDKEETIRYQAGLAEQIANTIRKIDGVLDADVEISFPPTQTGIGLTSNAPQRVTAAVYVKHQGVMDDPNNQLVSKIKRLVAGSVNALDVNDVTVISDRSRYSEISMNGTMELITPEREREYVSIWSVVMTKNSSSRFRFLFFTLLSLGVIFAVAMGWMMWKFYPILKKRGFKQLFKLAPLRDDQAPALEEEEDE